jgi:hypothetical protein
MDAVYNFFLHCISFCKDKAKVNNFQAPATLPPQQRKFVAKQTGKMNIETYNLLRKGHTEHPETGEPLRLSNEEMAAFKWKVAEEKFAKKKYKLKEMVIVRHNLKVTRYGCNVFDVVDNARAAQLCDKAPKEWTRFHLKKEPVGVEPTETRTRKKTADADV